MWELATAMRIEPDQVNQYLADGYEPFAVTLEPQSERIWFRRQLPNYGIIATLPKAPKEILDEIHNQQPKPKPRRRRKPASKPKA